MKPWDELTRLGKLRRLHSLATRALRSYDIRPDRVTLLHEELNAVYRVADAAGNRFVLRIGTTGPIGHSPDQVRCEVAWLQALRSGTGLAVPAPVPATSGDPLSVVEAPGVPDPRTCVLFRWLPGTQLADRLTTSNLAAYGALAAGLHVHGRRFVPDPELRPLAYDRVFPFDEPVVLFDPGVLAPGRRSLFRDAEALVAGAIDRLRGAEPMRILHGDLHVWNVLVHRGIAAAIDFEDLLMGWPVQDLGIALYYLHARPGYEDMKAAFRSGYETVAPWPERIGGEIAVFIAGRTLVLANDVVLLERAGDDIDAPAFFDRAERRLRDILATTD
jgi:Ser/Thr protein kinase RdoA (MazF antagonist)